MCDTAQTLAKEVVTLADRFAAPAADLPIPPAKATDALIAMLSIARSAPSHERDSERAELVRAIRAARSAD